MIDSCIQINFEGEDTECPMSQKISQTSRSVFSPREEC